MTTHFYLLGLLLSTLLSTVSSTPTPLVRRAANWAHLAINTSFPDPAVLNTPNGWFAYATSAQGKKVPFATSPDFKKWTLSSKDALPDPGKWTDRSKAVWAPDVVHIDDNHYVMYYSAVPAGKDRHCVGVATSSTPAGPFHPQDKPFVCPLEHGGAIDPSGFFDGETNKRYVVYKIDGWWVINGANRYTPIKTQEVKDDGFTQVGEPKVLTWYEPDKGDNKPLIEAPVVRKGNGIYYLFYSSGGMTDGTYNVRYATSKTLDHLFSNKTSLITSKNSGLFGPGGASFTHMGTNGPQGMRVVFHANIDPNDFSKGRNMYWTSVTANNGKVSIDGSLH